MIVVRGREKTSSVKELISNGTTESGNRLSDFGG